MKNSNCDNTNCTKNPNCYKTLNEMRQNLNNDPSNFNQIPKNLKYCGCVIKLLQPQPKKKKYIYIYIYKNVAQSVQCHLRCDCGNTKTKFAKMSVIIIKKVSMSLILWMTFVP